MIQNKPMEEDLEKQKKKIEIPPIQEEETDAEKINRDSLPPINVRKNIFDESRGIFGGINTEPSVFDKQTIIQTEGHSE